MPKYAITLDNDKILYVNAATIFDARRKVDAKITEKGSVRIIKSARKVTG